MESHHSSRSSRRQLPKRPNHFSERMKDIQAKRSSKRMSANSTMPFTTSNRKTASNNKMTQEQFINLYTTFLRTSSKKTNNEIASSIESLKVIPKEQFREELKKLYNTYKRVSQKVSVTKGGYRKTTGKTNKNKKSKKVKSRKMRK